MRGGEEGKGREREGVGSASRPGGHSAISPSQRVRRARLRRGSQLDGHPQLVNYPALTDGASRFIEALTPGILRVFRPASQRRFHPRASPLRSMGKAPPSQGLEAQISLFVTQNVSVRGPSIPHLTEGDFRPLNPHRVKPQIALTVGSSSHFF